MMRDDPADMMPTPCEPEEPRANWALTCRWCSSRIVGFLPMDVRLQADRSGWRDGLCRKCVKVATEVEAVLRNAT